MRASTLKLCAFVIPLLWPTNSLPNGGAMVPILDYLMTRQIVAIYQNSDGASSRSVCKRVKCSAIFEPETPTCRRTDSGAGMGRQLAKQVVKMPGLVPVRIEPGCLQRAAAHARLGVTPGRTDARGGPHPAPKSRLAD